MKLQVKFVIICPLFICALIVPFLFIGKVVFAEQRIFRGDGEYGIPQQVLIIDENDQSGDLKLQFGNALNEYILWDSGNLNFRFSNNIDLGGNQIKNFRVENINAAPTCDINQGGKIFYNNVSGKIFACNGSEWEQLDPDGMRWSYSSGTLYPESPLSKVAIGTNSAASPLHVSENTANEDGSAGLTIEQIGSGDAIAQFLLPNVQRWVIGIDNSDDDKFKIASSQNLDSDARLTIQTDGKVGIGTTTPDTALEVSGGILASEKAIASNSTIAIDWRDGNQQTVTLNQPGHAITFSNYKPGQVLRLIVCQDTVGGRAIISIPSEIKWAESTLPVLTTSPGKCDIFSFVATNARGAVEIFGSIAKNF